MGLKDVAALAEVIVDAARLGLDPGSLAVLERYQRWRRFDTMAMGVATDGLNRLFSNDSDVLRLVRDVGLGLVDRLPALKRFFIREAAGLIGECRSCSEARRCRVGKARICAPCPRVASAMRFVLCAWARRLSSSWQAPPGRRAFAYLTILRRSRQRDCGDLLLEGGTRRDRGVPAIQVRWPALRNQLHVPIHHDPDRMSP